MDLPINVPNASMEQFTLSVPVSATRLKEIGLTERIEPFPDPGQPRRAFAYDYLSKKECLPKVPYSFSICLILKGDNSTHVTLYTQANIKDKKIKEAQDQLVKMLNDLKV